MKKGIIIIGASGHGKVVADIAAKRYQEILFLDDALMTECMRYSVVGKSTEYQAYIEGYDFFVAIGNAYIRRRFHEKLKRSGASLVTLIHPNAVIAQNVKIGIGTVVMAGAVINPQAVIGEGCIINTCASVDHDCRIENYVHISVGAHIAGAVEVGECTCIGAGATVINNVRIIANCVIGAGAVVIKDILEAGTYVGTPVKRIHNN